MQGLLHLRCMTGLRQQTAPVYKEEGHQAEDAPQWEGTYPGEWPPLA